MLRDDRPGRVGPRLRRHVRHRCHATSPIEHRDAPPGRSVGEILADPRTLPVDDIITRTEYALAGRFATIAAVAELAGAAVAAGG